MIECCRLGITAKDYLNLSQRAAEFLDIGIQLSYLLYLIAADSDDVRKPNTQLHAEYFLKLVKTRLIYHEQDTFSELREGRQRFLLGEGSVNILNENLEEIEYESNWDEEDC